MITVVVALLVTACGGLPSRTEVQLGRGVDEKVAQAARILAAPPAPGADQEEIVRGFLRAGAAYQEPTDSGEVVGKAYLAPDSVMRWTPAAVATVFDRSTAPTVVRLGPDRLRASVKAVAVVDDTGHYRELSPGTIVELDVQLVQIEAEWRLVLPASGFGIWVNTDDFDRLFRPYAVAYPVAGTRRLLSDIRWMPFGPRLVTALARAQAAPPPDYLVGVVESGFPASARLAVEAVPVRDGVATVVLTPPAENADVDARRAMWAQFAATLLAVPDVTEVVVEVQASGRLAVPDLPSRVRSLSDTGYRREAPAPPTQGLLRVGDRLARVELSRLGDPGASAGPSADLPQVPVSIIGLATGPDTSDVAGVNVGRTELVRWHLRQRITMTGIGTGLVDPAFDGWGRVWTAGIQDGVGAVWWADATTAEARPASRIVAAWLQDRVPQALAISPDGTRLALMSTDRAGGGLRLDVAGVTRGGDGLPRSLAMPMLVDAPFASIRDVCWLDDLSLGVLATVPGLDAARVYVAELGQGIGLRRRGVADPEAALLPVAAGARAIVATSGVRGIVVVTGTVVLARAGSGWRLLVEGSDLAVPPSPPLDR